MMNDLLKGFGAMTAAGAVLFGAGAAHALVYDFALTGVVADGAYSTFGDLSFYELTLTTPDDFQPFELAVGDVINLTVNLDTFLNVPAGTGTTFFGVDVITSQRFGYPPADGSTGNGNVTFVDGDFAGQDYGSSCTNCLAATAIFTPGPAFSVSQFTATINVENLYNLDPDDMTPFFANAFQLRYQIDNGPGGVVPEPSTWAMMILGFGAAGTLLRRRRLAAA